MLTRIYGTAFASKAELDEHLERLEQARARDHRKLGRELGLFTVLRALAGLAVLAAERARRLCNAARRALARDGAPSAATPRSRRRMLYDVRAVEDLGPLGQVPREHVLHRVEGRESGLKPMNCPGHAQLYELQRCSYRDLPIRYSEPGLAAPPRAVRHAARPAARAPLHPGRRPHLLHRGPDRRTRSRRCLDFAFAIYGLFGFDVARRALHPPGEAHRLRRAVGPGRGGARARARRPTGSTTSVNEGDGAFYGPKIDLHMTDSIGRSWQLGTVQLDYNMPERFELTYTGADNAEHRPVMIHRALMGSFERFIGILIEHYAGEFPVWLAPVQAIVLPVADRHVELRATRSQAALGAGCASRSTTARSRSGARSARPSCARSPTCSWSATARPRRARSSLRRHREGDQGALSLDEARERLTAD